jgi:hypothetical protein
MGSLRPAATVTRAVTQVRSHIPRTARTPDESKLVHDHHVGRRPAKPPAHYGAAGAGVRVGVGAEDP